jgi:hypothetical protein
MQLLGTTITEGTKLNCEPCNDNTMMHQELTLDQDLARYVPAPSACCELPATQFTKHNFPRYSSGSAKHRTPLYRAISQGLHAMIKLEALMSKPSRKVVSEQTHTLMEYWMVTTRGRQTARYKDVCTGLVSLPAVRKNLCRNIAANWTGENCNNNHGLTSRWEGHSTVPNHHLVIGTNASLVHRVPVVEVVPTP